VFMQRRKTLKSIETLLFGNLGTQTPSKAWDDKYQQNDQPVRFVGTESDVSQQLIPNPHPLRIQVHKMHLNVIRFLNPTSGYLRIYCNLHLLIIINFLTHTRKFK
jgi:hypothetical protein